MNSRSSASLGFEVRVSQPVPVARSRAETKDETGGPGRPKRDNIKLVIAEVGRGAELLRNKNSKYVRET